MNKIITLDEIILNRSLEEIKDILQTLQEEYEIPVEVKEEQIAFVLKSFFKYYKDKEIAYRFYEMMTGHFEDIAILAIDHEVPVNIDFILAQLRLFELLDSPIEVNPKDTKKVIKKIRTTLERGEKRHEGKHN